MRRATSFRSIAPYLLLAPGLLWLAIFFVMVNAFGQIAWMATYPLWSVLIITLGITWWMTNSPMGFYLPAVRDSERAAPPLGAAAVTCSEAIGFAEADRRGRGQDRRRPLRDGRGGEDLQDHLRLRRRSGREGCREGEGQGRQLTHGSPAPSPE